MFGERFLRIWPFCDDEIGALDATTTKTDNSAASTDTMTDAAALGDGPKRFALDGELTVEEQMKALTDEQRDCIDTLRKKWAKEQPDAEPFDDAMLLRFARNSPGKTKFNPKTALKTMKKYDRKYSALTAAGLEEQLLSKTLFPVPGLKTKEGGHATFYMRPSRYFPKKTSTATIIENLAYCMGTMVEAEKECTEGIAFMANMDE